MVGGGSLVKQAYQDTVGTLVLTTMGWWDGGGVEGERGGGKGGSGTHRGSNSMFSSPPNHIPSNSSQLVQLLRYHGFVVKRVFQVFSEYCLD